MEHRKVTLSRRAFLGASAGMMTGVFLAACAPAAPAPPAPVEQPTAAKAEEQPTTAPAAPAAPAGAATELGLLLVDWNEAFRTILDGEILPAFQQANPGVTVLVDYTDWGQLDPKVMTAAAGGLAPDLFMADGVEFGPKYYTRGILAELDPYVEAAGGQKVLDDFYTKAIEEGSKFKGKLIALPYLLDNRGLFYRKDYLNEAGLDPNKAPQNWDEFRTAAIKMTKMKADGTWERAGFHNDTGFACFQVYNPLLWENGGSVLNAEQTKCAFNSDEGVQALELWTNLIRTDKVGPVENMPAVGDMDAFVAGLKAMQFGGYGTLQNISNYNPDIKDQVGVTVLGQKEKGSLWYANGYLMPKGKNQDLAWKLLSDLVLNDKNFMSFLVAMDTLPPRKSLTATAPHLTPNHKILIEDVMNAPASHSSPQVPSIFEVLQRIDEAIQKSIFGQATPREALDTAATEGNAILDRVLSGQG
jgi:ABC-type glycerol-3-phosphate transport system substrate-binding protein